MSGGGLLLDAACWLLSPFVAEAFDRGKCRLCAGCSAVLCIGSHLVQATSFIFCCVSLTTRLLNIEKPKV